MVIWILKQRFFPGLDEDSDNYTFQQCVLRHIFIATSALI